MNYQEYKADFELFLKQKPSKKEILSFVSQAEENHQKYRVSIRKAAFAVSKDTHTAIALELIEPCIDEIKDLKFLRTVQKRYDKLRLIEKSNYLVDLINKRSKMQLVEKAVVDFINNIENHDIDYAMRQLKDFFKKYYYLERTILKRIYKFSKNNYPEYAKSIAMDVNERFGDALL